ncbi:MAG TPA: hypothetical protein VHW02_10135 [Rhizomicrobium sp.]|jgi:hypothetical protein|nr:hypothetical protein [Rhizomicrobium sp.]
MMTPEKLQMLRAFLGKLPEPVAAQLARAIEAERLAGGHALPHDAILDGLRPALRRARRAKRRSPLRLFCLPFEDLLNSRPRTQKQKGRIARASISRVWKWLAHKLLAERTAQYAAAVKRALLENKQDAADEAALSYWADAAKAIRAALSDEKQAAATRKALRDEATQADAVEMALMLSAGGEIAAFQDEAPRPIEAMTDDMLWTFRGLYDRLVQTVPDAAPYVAIIAMNRLERPWEALRLPLMISRQTQETMISSTDMGLVGEILFSDMEMHANAIRAVRHPVFDPDDLVHHGHRFAVLSNGLVKEVGIRRDGKWGQRLLTDRAAIAEVMEGLMDHAPREILGLFHLHKANFGKGARVPDLSRAMDAEKLDRAMRYARLLQGCKSFAVAGAFGAALQTACDRVSAELALYDDALVAELRAAEGEKRQRVEAYFQAAADLTALVLSEKDAEIMRRRGRAALAA